MRKCRICGISFSSYDMMESHPKIHDGRRLLILGSYMDAVKAFTEAISIHPGLPSAYRYIAEAYRRLGKIEKADPALREAESIEKSKDQEVDQSIDVMEELSPQDLEILKLLVIQGVSNQTVAHCMRFSENSSHVQISRILEKVDSPGRDFLVNFAEEHGILSSASGDDTNRRSNARVSSYEPLPENVRLKRLIGSNEVLPGQLNEPEGIATDECDNIYVVDRGHHCVQVFNRSGEFLFKWGSEGSGVGEFNNPQGITLDHSGRVYVVDRGNKRIQVFSHSGAFLFKWGSEGSGVGEFLSPGDIAVSEDGIVYVTDSVNFRVQAFGSEGEFLREWGGYGPEDGRFISPWGITVGLDGTVFVTEDILNYRVQAFSPSGGFLSQWGTHGMPWQVRYPNWGVRRAIAVSPTGNIVVGGGEGGTLWNIDDDEEPGSNSVKWSSRDRAMQVRLFSTTGKLLDSWGVFATDGYMLQGLACDSSGKIVTSVGNTDQVKIFSEGGEFLGLVGAPVWSSDGQLRRPSGIAVDQTGRIFVADPGNNRVQVFGPDGVSLGRWGSAGDADGLFAGLEGIAIDGSGRIYTVETDNNRVQVFSREGTFLKKWGSSGSETGQFKYPTDITIDPSGNVYVTDRDNYRVQVFDNNGEYLRQWGSQGNEDGQFGYTCQIATDQAGKVYVGDSSNNRIQAFNNQGKFLNRWGTRGQGDGQFNSIKGISVDRWGHVYVSDSNRVQVFSSEGEFLTKWYLNDENTGEPGYIQGIAASVHGDIYVVDASNNIVKEFSVDVPAPGGRKEKLTSSRMSTLVGVSGPIEVIRGQSVFPTGPDRANTSDCQFSKPISTITLALVREGKTAFEYSIQLLPPQRLVTFPLNPKQVPLVPKELENGRYVRWVQATSPDDETIEISNDFIWIND